jgi:molecular chaperone HtpG
VTKRKFETEVSQLLQLIIHSLYSNQEVFLRELISNASDALDKLKHLKLTSEEYKDTSFDPRIDISFDAESRLLTVKDNGIGMNQEDLVEQLGTIARSGTRNFLENLSGDQSKDANLIGQFGVGFYSSYMVADFVEVTTKKANEDRAWRWSSNGLGEYEIDSTERDSHGTTVELRLNEAGREYANRWSVESVIKKYSNHISVPIYLHFEDSRYKGEGDDRKEIKEAKVEQVNDGTALWKKPKRDLEEKDYTEFYKAFTNDHDTPMLTCHTQAEGALEYTTLFYVPKKAPADLYYSTYTPGVKLYVKRIFITDDDKELLPTWLRFVRGVIDSEDLPLNVSREILQQNPVMNRIRTAAVKKLLDEFKNLAQDEEKYSIFWAEFGRPIKEGLYHDYPNRERLLELVRFKSSKKDGWTSLASYVESMNKEQKAIYFITGEKENTLRNSPLLEAYRNKDIEVLIMDDEVDEIVVPSIGKYKDFEFKSINRTDAEEDIKSEKDKESEKEIDPLVKRIKETLGDKVKDVKASTRLSDSPSCIVVDANDPTVQMQGILKSMGQSVPGIKPILEINPTHKIVTHLDSIKDEDMFSAISHLLLEQAMIIEGMAIEQPADFVKRLNTVLELASH